ncbi:hypothetical protein Lal_00023860 [Lupinus albus]|uniref:Putative sterile alpha motif/pointed domain-containing protein n=1 Tax=Lupinus albus TaxID=3870 RepID=A0A6A4PIV1_LUPAL|nr:putative sterile alpha motif/pointed domain-containing protein [Lupinus albus]KAF1887852.1 hypothetical protein Lal_00023860 [Lupinus albus]
MAEIQPLPEDHVSAAAGGFVSKRQRKPSVRLGDIGGGGPPYANSHHHPRRKNNNNNTHKRYKPHPLFNDPNPSIKPSKIRPLTNLAPFQTLDRDGERGHVDTLATGTWRINESSKKMGPTKRARSNWVSTDEERGFDVQNSESPFSEELSPMENIGVDGLQLQHHRRSSSFIGSDGPSDTNATRDWNKNNGEDGVRVWLSGLGLSRYFSVFRVHEVDYEILPMLTLEDLKDMGISAVGTRRKMYSAIQKLGEGFS